MVGWGQGEGRRGARGGELGMQGWGLEGERRGCKGGQMCYNQTSNKYGIVYREGTDIFSELSSEYLKSSLVKSIVQLKAWK